MKENLFVYGTLLEPDIQKEAVGRVGGGTPDVLEDYEKRETFIDGEDYPFITPKKGAKVKGLVLEVSTEELGILDDYEENYERKKIGLKSGKEAWVYMIKLEVG